MTYPRHVRVRLQMTALDSTADPTSAEPKPVRQRRTAGHSLFKGVFEVVGHHGGGQHRVQQDERSNEIERCGSKPAKRATWQIQLVAHQAERLSACSHGAAAINGRCL